MLPRKRFLNCGSCISFALLASFSLPVASSTLFAQEFDDPPEVELKVVRIGLRLIDVTKIDSREETFTVEGILYVDWHDPSQAAEPGEFAEANVDDRLKNMEWWPAPEFENGRGTRERSGMLLGIYEDGSIEYEERFSLTFGAELDLRQFPFDTQVLPIRIIIGGGPEDYVQLEISEFSPGLVRLPEWQFSDSSFSSKIEKGVRPYEAENSPSFNRALFSIEIQRRWGFYFWRIILPLLIITSVSWAVFWMKREDLGSRLGVSFTALLTVVAFNLIVADALPRIAYLTFLDTLITLTYLWLGVTIIQSVTVSQMAGAEPVAKAQKMDSISKWLIPSSYYLACVVILFMFWARQ